MRDGMRTLYIHVGTHKTGTTSLQQYLFDHQETLKRSKFKLITETHRNYGEIASCMGFAHSILRNGLQTVARMIGAMSASTSFRSFISRRRLRRMLRRLPENSSAILSSEALSFARTAEETSRLRKIFLGLDLRIISVVCFRNESDWRLSWENELHTWSDRMHQNFGDEMDDIRGDWYFDKKSILAFWQQFGDVRCVDFDQSVAEAGSVLPGLLTALDAPIASNLDPYVLRQRQ